MADTPVDPPREPDDPDRAFESLPQPVVAPPRWTGFSLIWFVPIVALLIAASLFIRTVVLVGPTIDIEFASADGIEAGKTDVRYKEVVIGKVVGVALRGDRNRVIVTVRLDRASAPGFAVEDTLYWVVRPRISTAGITGLGTLLSGAYIAADAGVSTKSRASFIGLEVPPLVLRGEPGTVFELKAEDLGSLEVGSPLFYRRARVGRVVGYTLDPKADELSIRIFVEAPYQDLVTPEARFWNASGVDLRLSASGLTLNTQTLASVLAGGVAFENPQGRSRTAPAPAGTVFTLFADRQSALAPDDGTPVSVRMVFDQSVRGLSENAPVDFLGVEIGRVRSIALQFDAKRKRFPVLVTAEIFPLRLGAVHRALFSGVQGDPAAESMVVQRLVEKGLAAQLRTGNLLTGQLYVALDFGTGAKRVDTAEVVDGAVELPTVPGTLAELQPQLVEVVHKLANVPFDEIGRNLNSTLKGAGDAIARLAPQAQKALADVSQTLSRAQQSLESLDRLTGPNAPLQHGLDDTLRQLQRAARSLRTLSDYLQLHPEALLRGKPRDPDIRPRRGSR